MFVVFTLFFALAYQRNTFCTRSPLSVGLQISFFSCCVEKHRVLFCSLCRRCIFALTNLAFWRLVKHYCFIFLCSWGEYVHCLGPAPFGACLQLFLGFCRLSYEVRVLIFFCGVRGRQKSRRPRFLVGFRVLDCCIVLAKPCARRACVRGAWW